MFLYFFWHTYQTTVPVLEKHEISFNKTRISALLLEFFRSYSLSQLRTRFLSCQQQFWRSCFLRAIISKTFEQQTSGCYFIDMHFKTVQKGPKFLNFVLLREQRPLFKDCQYLMSSEFSYFPANLAQSNMSLYRSIFKVFELLSWYYIQIEANSYPLNLKCFSENIYF